MPATALNPEKFGVRVTCAVCGRTKCPRGRSQPLGLSMCDSECRGYNAEPHVGSLWPDESEADFGYPVGDIGTRTT